MASVEADLGGPSRSRRLISLLGRVLVSGVVLGWLLWRTDWSPLLTTLRQVRPELCLMSLVIYCTAQLISSYRWQMLARPLGFTDPWRRFVSLYFVGMFFNLFLPTSMGGDVVRAWYLSGGPGRRWLAALTVFSERFAGLLMLLVLACLATLPNLRVLPLWALIVVWTATLGGLGGVALLPLLSRWSKRLAKVAMALSLYRGQFGRLALAMALSLLVQMAGILQIWVLGQALGLDVPLLAYAVIIPLVTLLTLLPVSVNGVGVREGSLVLLLTPLGVPEAGAVALGLLWLSVLVAASLIGGGVYLLGRFSRKEWEHADGPVRGHSHQGRTGQPVSAP